MVHSARRKKCVFIRIDIIFKEKQNRYEEQRSLEDGCTLFVGILLLINKTGQLGS